MRMTNAETTQKFPSNPEGLPVEHRVIASVLVLSSDNKLLMGRKDPTKGGVYPDAWHIPGGGVKVGESLEQAASRELLEETGLSVNPENLEKLKSVGHGKWEKTKPDGIKIWCEMEFNRFVARLPQTADELHGLTRESGDLINLQWFDRQELTTVEQIPGGREMMVAEGFIDS